MIQPYEVTQLEVIAPSEVILLSQNNKTFFTLPNVI